MICDADTGGGGEGEVLGGREVEGGGWGVGWRRRRGRGRRGVGLEGRVKEKWEGEEKGVVGGGRQGGGNEGDGGEGGGDMGWRTGCWRNRMGSRRMGWRKDEEGEVIISDADIEGKNGMGAEGELGGGGGKVEGYRRHMGGRERGRKKA